MLDLPEALQGCKLFPIIAGSKDPATKHGWKDASADLAQHAVWSRDFPGCNWAVACGLSGLFVFDIDPAGIQAWENEITADPVIAAVMKKAFTVKTPKGGYHVYFRGEGPTTASRITDGVDTRGGMMIDGKLVSGGYVLLPGSSTVDGPGRVTGSYQAMGGEILEFTPAVRALVPERKKTATKGLIRNPEHDQPRNVVWALDLLHGYVKNGRVSVQGKGGNNLAFQVVCSILDKAISPALCYDMLIEHWNDHCQPPWDDLELESLVRNASEYGEDTGGGVKGYQTNADAFADMAEILKDWTPQDAPKKIDRPRGHVQPIHIYAASVDDPTWLIPGFIPAQGAGMLYGGQGSYKSFVAFDIAACLAYGIAGQWNAPPVKSDVLFIAGEAPIGMAKLRWPAWVEWQEIADPLDHRMFFLDRVPAFTDTERWESIKADLAGLNVRPALIIIDTATRLAFGSDENSSKDITQITFFAEQLSQYYECFVLLIHHAGKDEKKGARGSSAWAGNLDSMLSTTKRAKGLELRVQKHKDADASDDAFYFKIKKVGASIVLERTEALSETPKAGKARTDWASQEEITAFLGENGPQSTTMLAQIVATANGLLPEVVRKKILHKQDLQWLRADENTWSLPGVVRSIQEYDL